MNRDVRIGAFEREDARAPVAPFEYRLTRTAFVTGSRVVGMIHELCTALNAHLPLMPAEAQTTPDPESQQSIRERVIRLAFGGDPRRFDEFVRALRDATPPGVEVILRGSSVTGHQWGSH